MIISPVMTSPMIIVMTSPMMSSPTMTSPRMTMMTTLYDDQPHDEQVIIALLSALESFAAVLLTAARYREMWGDTGRYGEMRGDEGRCREIQGDMGRYRRDIGRSGRPAQS